MTANDALIARLRETAIRTDWGLECRALNDAADALAAADAALATERAARETAEREREALREALSDSNITLSVVSGSLGQYSEAMSVVKARINSNTRVLAALAGTP